MYLVANQRVIQGHTGCSLSEAAALPSLSTNASPVSHTCTQLGVSFTFMHFQEAAGGEAGIVSCHAPPILTSGSRFGRFRLIDFI
jgi:hypothetical protein